MPAGNTYWVKLTILFCAAVGDAGTPSGVVKENKSFEERLLNLYTFPILPGAFLPATSSITCLKSDACVIARFDGSFWILSNVPASSRPFNGLYRLRGPKKSPTSTTDLSSSGVCESSGL